MPGRLPHTDKLLIRRIERRVVSLLDAAAPLFQAARVAAPRPQVRCDLRGRAAGQMRWAAGPPPVLRFNLALARAHSADFIHQTVAHEVAHLVTAACHGKTRPHGREWRAAMAFFGLPDAPRCHSYTVDTRDVRQQRRWPYVCRCDAHDLSTTRHNRVQAGASRYVCRKCGSTLCYAGKQPLAPDKVSPA